MVKSIEILLRDKYKNSSYEEFFTYLSDILDQVDEKYHDEIIGLVEIITG